MSRTPVTPWKIASGVTSLSPILADTRVAKLLCCGSLPPIAPMIEKANVGPKATIAPSTCRNSTHGNNVVRSTTTLPSDQPLARVLAEDTPYDTRFERRPTKSTSTYSPSRSGVA